MNKIAEAYKLMHELGVSDDAKITGFYKAEMAYPCPLCDRVVTLNFSDGDFFENSHEIQYCPKCQNAVSVCFYAAQHRVQLTAFRRGWWAYLGNYIVRLGCRLAQFGGN